VARIKPGMKARFTLRSDSRTFEAKITYVADAADDQSRMVQVTAEVAKEGAEAVRPGAFATVVVPVATAKGAPVVPQTSVRPSERGFLAYVVDDGLARERVLELGLRTADGLVEVREGVKPGERIVVRGAEALKDGAPVRMAEGAKPGFSGEPRRQTVDQRNGGNAGGAAP
jgi:multidrug efflux system membrane fusion protein